MRRLLPIATFVLLLATLPALAQMRGGGHGSASGHGGFAGHSGFVGHVGGGHSFGVMQGGSAFHGPRFHNPRLNTPGLRNPRFATRGFNRSPFLHQPNFRQPWHQSFRGNGFHRRDRDRDHDRDDREDRLLAFSQRNCFGCRGWGGWPWWYAGYYDPWWWWDSGSSYDEDREREIQLANEMNAQSLEEQRARRNEQDSYARSDSPPPQRQEERAEATPATVLVFRDQHKQEVQNYAIVGQTLWAFAAQRTQKIPLADLDILATQKANDERGVDFRMPGDGQGQ